MLFPTDKRFGIRSKPPSSCSIQKSSAFDSPMDSNSSLSSSEDEEMDQMESLWLALKSHLETDTKALWNSGNVRNDAFETALQEAQQRESQHLTTLLKERKAAFMLAIEQIREKYKGQRCVS